MEIDIRTNIAKNIKRFRKEKGMTQEQLGYYLNVAKTTVSTWELGTSLPDAEKLFQICFILCVSLSDMYGGDTVAREDKLLSRTESEIVDAYRRAPEGRKDSVRALLDVEGKGIKYSAS